MSLNAFADGYNKGYSAGYDDATEDRAYIPARVRELEAELAEARAAERAAIAAYLRTEANRRVETLERADRRRFVMAYASIHHWADAIERGEHLTTLSE